MIINNLIFKDSRELNHLMNYVLMDNMYHAQNNFRNVWIDELSEGVGQRDSVPWALKEGFVEEFKVNGRTRLLLTRKGRDYIKTENEKFAERLMVVGF